MADIFHLLLEFRLPLLIFQALSAHFFQSAVDGFHGLLQSPVRQGQMQNLVPGHILLDFQQIPVHLPERPLQRKIPESKIPSHDGKKHAQQYCRRNIPLQDIPPRESRALENAGKNKVL